MVTFYTVSENPRPVRLKEETRQFAWDSLQGRYGDEAMEYYAIPMDGEPGFLEKRPSEQFIAAMLKIAREAPLRVCPQERICGAATLGLGTRHYVPATLKGKPIWESTSHVTLGFDRVVYEGVDAMEQEVIARQQDPDLTEHQQDVLAEMRALVQALHIWHERYQKAVKDSHPDTWANLQQVPFKPARTFHEAVQSLWFMFSFARLYGNWPGIGRIDVMLGSYLKKDLQEGRLTLDEAREIMASFFIKGCEWVRSNPELGSGDAQHYQNIILAGLGEDEQEVANEVTYLVLDVVEELSISDFPISLRLNQNTPERLLRRAAEVMSHGGGIVAVYNEPLVLKSLRRAGYSRRDALKFANDGCWEVQVPGETYFSYRAFDCLQILLQDTLHLDEEEPANFASYEELEAAFLENLDRKVREWYRIIRYPDYTAQKRLDWCRGEKTPCPVMSFLTRGCVEKAESYLAGGARFTVVSPHMGGAPDTGNSLYALKKLVFEEKKLTFAEMMQTLKNNWEGQEYLRQHALNHFPYYGNDDDESDSFTVKVLDAFAKSVEACNRKEDPFLFVPGISTFGRQISWAPFRAAVPFGRKKGDILSANDSPSPGTDRTGATAIIKSYCKPHLEWQTNGAALDVKLHPTATRGEDGIQGLMGLMRGFLELGGFFMQLDILDARVLEEAQKNPEAYKTLSVRVSGWNARFVTLDKEWQEMIMERSAQGM